MTSHRAVCRLVVVVLTLAGAACSGGGERPGTESSETPALTVADTALSADSRAFLDAHWRRPVPMQGEPPAGWAPITTDLDPQACATCHPVQFRDWSDALHAHAYSPGLEGQLVSWFETAPGTVQSCMTCHGPLSEQLRSVAGPEGGWVDNAAFDADLERNGLVCAGCHVRDWTRHGPPRRDGSFDPAPEGTPHDGAVRHTAYEESQFCAACHQFEAPAPNGKPLENTLREWQATSYAREGVTCQSCHMPDRRHLWKGIHDPEMTAQGVTPEWSVDDDPADDDYVVRLSLTNTGTGHHFPTYVTPAVDLEIAFLDANKDTLEVRRRTLQRDVAFQGGQWVEREDDRIPAGGTRSLVWRGPAPADAVQVVGHISVRPDAFYTNVFRSMIPRATGRARELLEEALERSLDSHFTIGRWYSGL